MTLGLRPSRRYNQAWMTQRILNRIPEWTYARGVPISVANQIINPIGEEIQNTVQVLSEEKLNIFLSTCNPTLLDHLYRAEITTKNFEFNTVLGQDGTMTVLFPAIYAMINGQETEIAIAENNNIETLHYFCLPTRVEGLSRTILWEDVIPETEAWELYSITPEDLVLDGHLYITLTENTTWRREFKNVYYYSKIKIIGRSRKGTEIEETVPLRENGTFRTRNQWQQVDEVYASHLDGGAKLSLSCLPMYENPILDTRNISIPTEGGERDQYLKLGTENFGSTLVAESYVNPDMDTIRLGLDAKRIDYKLELLDENGNNVNINGFLLKPFSDWIYAISDTHFYVYDRRLPYPNASLLREETPDVRISLQSDNWIYTRGETTTVYTWTIDALSIPTAFRWTITEPSGTEYRVGVDGSYWPTTEEGWIANPNPYNGTWTEQSMDFLLDQTGEYIVRFDVKYLNEEDTFIEETTKMLLYVPAIRPEVQLALPNDLLNCQNLFLDSDANLWFYNGTSIIKAMLYYDYFLVDYQRKTIWLKENYPSIRVET